MKHNYVIICLDSMFEAFLVADEFEFLRIRDVFDISLPSIQFGCEETICVDSPICVIVLWVLNCVCHISFCNVSRRIHKHFLFDVSMFETFLVADEFEFLRIRDVYKSLLYHGNW